MAQQLISVGSVASDSSYDSTRTIAVKANSNFSELYGLVGGGSNALGTTGTAAPTTGAHTQGEWVRNTAPTELGTTGTKFVVLGWLCLVSGTPGTWVPNNVFTGN